MGGLAGDGGVADLFAEPQEEDDEHRDAEGAALDYINELIEAVAGPYPERIGMATLLHTISFPAERDSCFRRA
jgi:hypothetical protein